MADLIAAAGDSYVAAACLLLEKLLTMILNKDKEKKPQIEEFAKYWIDDYLKTVRNGNYRTIKGIISYINPMLCKLDPNIVSLLLSKVCLFQ